MRHHQTDTTQKKTQKRELQPITYHLSLSNPSPVFPPSLSLSEKLQTPVLPE